MLAWQAGPGKAAPMLEAVKLIVAVKNIEMPDERHAFGCAPCSKVAAPASAGGRCSAPAG
jgi:hypothetical protein